MDPSRLQILVTVAYPAMLGAILIFISYIGCRLHAHHQRLTSLEFRVYTMEIGPRITVALPPSSMLDPMPPHV
jgi:hypothetical protein